MTRNPTTAADLTDRLRMALIRNEVFLQAYDRELARNDNHEAQGLPIDRTNEAIYFDIWLANNDEMTTVLQHRQDRARSEC